MFVFLSVILLQGDNDPVDVVEIGSKTLAMGTVTKVLKCKAI